ncbi:DUF3159 domain-containing protein [Mycolicibacterium hodleri]|uniref:DUF3159 domain-containing protein n=1 Tax=Mycolicibacterium hodleri TaxID=49897 RepID=A0A502ED13_9MYCO|nr:DUF3159 domain-containing protein [Mycolicibacterium hodleri]TPG34899.1 DUF3159 domain-containing protein [Mycolicibacterium hodleri]
MTDTDTPLAALLVRAGGVRGLVYSSLPVTTFGAVNAASDLRWALIAAVGVAAVVMTWQLVRRESIRPALFGFAGVAVGASLAFVTGKAKDFYLPGIWMYLLLAVVFTASVVIRRPLIGVGWAWVTGRDAAWRRVPRVRRAFDLVTIVMAVASWARFAVQYYLYDTNQEGLLAAARIAMGWPIFLLTSTLIYLAIRTAIRALPRSAEAA